MFKKLVSLLAAAALALGLIAAPAVASQGSLCLPVVSPLPGLTLVQDINAALAALVSSNSGGTSPTNPCGSAPVKGQIWLDTSTTPAVIRSYDGVSTWVALGQLDAVNHLWEPPIGGNTGTIVGAATTDLGSVNASYISITGTVGISSFGSTMAKGTTKVVQFAAVTTLTYNGTSMILPTGAPITTQAGDTALVTALGSSNYIVTDYLHADGTPLSFGTGAITGTNIAAGTVANSNLANMAQSTIKGRAAGAGTGAPTDLSATQATAVLNNMVGDSGSGGTAGLAPAPGAGDAAAGKYLSAGGGYSTPPLGGMSLISTLTTTSGSTAIFTSIPTTYKILRFVFLGNATNSTTFMRLNISNDNGSSYDSAAGVSLSITSSELLYGYVDVTSANAASTPKFMQVNSQTTDNSQATSQQHVFSTKTGTINAAKFDWNNADTFRAGSIALYGIN